MISSSYPNRFTEMPLAEFRLIHQAKSGDANAFVELYDSCVERVYRYIHFLVPNNRAAEGLTFQVFIKAWEQLDRYPIFRISFIIWLYSVARNQVIVYHRTHKNTIAPDNEFSLAARGGTFRQEFQAIRDAMSLLPMDQQHVLALKFIVGMSDKNIARLIAKREEDVYVLQTHALYALTDHLIKTDSRTITKAFRRILEDCLLRISTRASTLEECLVRYPKHAAQLEPLLETAFLLDLGRDVKPLSTFNAYTHDALIHYLRSHPRRAPINVMPSLRRMALTFAMLVVALVVTGTAQAQSALPGDAFYPWKRTSENIWLALSPNSVAVDLMLAERRLDEWIAVADDPALNVSAMNNYQEALSRLESADDVESAALIASELQVQQKTLKQAGLSSPNLDVYLIKVSGLLPQNVHSEGVPAEVLPMNDPNKNAVDNCAPDCNDVHEGNSNTDGKDDAVSGNSNPGGKDNTAGSNNNAGGNSNNAGGKNDNAGGKKDNPGGKDDNAGDKENNGKSN